MDWDEYAFSIIPIGFGILFLFMLNSYGVSKILGSLSISIYIVILLVLSFPAMSKVREIGKNYTGSTQLLAEKLGDLIIILLLYALAAGGTEMLLFNEEVALIDIVLGGTQFGLLIAFMLITNNNLSTIETAIKESVKGKEIIHGQLEIDHGRTYKRVVLAIVLISIVLTNIFRLSGLLDTSRTLFFSGVYFTIAIALAWISISNLNKAVKKLSGTTKKIYIEFKNSIYVIALFVVSRALHDLFVPRVPLGFYSSLMAGAELGLTVSFFLLSYCISLYLLDEGRSCFLTEQ